MNHSGSRGVGAHRALILDQLEKDVSHTLDRFAASVVSEPIRGGRSTAGDLLALPAAVDLGTAEWAVLEVGGDSRPRAVPADSSPLLGSADVAAPECRVLRCGVAIWLEPAVLKGARRTGRLDADTLAAARERCRALEEGRLHGSLQALETDRDPDYQQLIREMKAAASVLAQKGGMEEPLKRERHRRRPAPRRRRIAAIAASLFFAVALLLIAVQRRTIDELRRENRSLVAGPPVVWLESGRERGSLEMRSIPEGTRFVLLVLRPEWARPTPPDAFRLRLFTASDREEEVLWTGTIEPGEIPELFVLVPGEQLTTGEYRLELTGQRDGEEFPAGIFRLRAKRTALSPGS